MLVVAMAATDLLAFPQGQAGTTPPPVPPAPPVITGSVRQLVGSQLPGRKLPPPAILSRPSARFSLLFLQYRRADSEAAVDSLSKWTEGEVLSEAVPSPTDDAWTRAALVSMLTEAGIRKGTFGRFSDYSPASILLTGWGLDKNFEVYSFRAFSLVKDLTRIAQTKRDDTLLTFCSRWYVIAASYSLRNGRQSREGLQAMANHDLNDRPEIQLFIGSFYEAIAGPFVSTAIFTCWHPPLVQLWFEGPDGCIRDPEPPPPGAVNPKREALWGFRSALKTDSSLVEAHLRLGRFLHLLGQNLEAREHLEIAYGESKKRNIGFMTYMAGLFLGELDEHEDRLTDAVAHIRAAVDADPTAHIANVALGDAMLRAGDSQGWADARHLFDDEDQNHPKKLDPWFFYRFAQYWQVAAGLREMRQIVKDAR
jgi:hypothetical protein